MKSSRKIQRPKRFLDEGFVTGDVESDFDKLDSVFNSSVVEDDVMLDVSASEDIFQDEEDNVVEPTLTQEFGTVNQDRGVDAHTTNSQRIMDMRNDPVFKEMLNQAVAEQMKLVKQKTVQLEEHGTPKTSNILGDKRLEIESEVVSGDKARGNNVKSPSDTMIYAPGLHFAHGKDRNSPHKSANEVMINQISDFVERIRIDAECDNGNQRNRNRDDSPEPGTSGMVNMGNQRSEQPERPQLQGERFHHRIK